MESLTEKKFLCGLREELECTVCLQLASSPIYACKNGHLLCGICFEKTQTCGVCKTTFSQSTFAERLSERYELTDDCKNKAAGCEEIIKCSLMKTHIKECDYRPITCNSSSDKDCYGKLFELKNYIKHAIDNHSCRNFLNGKSCSFFFSVKKGNDAKSLDIEWKWVYLKLDDVTTIGLRVILKHGTVFWWLGIADGNKMASNFRCKTAILKYNGIADKFEEEVSSLSLLVIPLNSCVDDEEALMSGKIGSMYYTALQHIAKKTELPEETKYEFFIKVDIARVNNIEKELTVYQKFCLDDIFGSSESA